MISAPVSSNVASVFWNGSTVSTSPIVTGPASMDARKPPPLAMAMVTSKDGSLTALLSASQSIGLPQPLKTGMRRCCELAVGVVVDEDERAELPRSLAERRLQVLAELLADVGSVEGVGRVAGVELAQEVEVVFEAQGVDDEDYKTKIALDLQSGGGADVGLLVRAGKVKKLVYAFVSLDSVPLEPNFPRARQTGTIPEIVEMITVWAALESMAYQSPLEALSERFHIKPELLAEATRNARAAAEQFAADSGSAIAEIRRASQGLFEILARDPAPNLFEPNQLDKKIRVVSTIEYRLSR